MERCVPVWAWHVRALTPGCVFLVFGGCMTCFTYDVCVYISTTTFGFCVFLFFFSLGYHSTPTVTGACSMAMALIVRVYARKTTYHLGHI